MCVFTCVRVRACMYVFTCVRVRACMYVCVGAQAGHEPHVKAARALERADEAAEVVSTDAGVRPEPLDTFGLPRIAERCTCARRVQTRPTLRVA